VQPREPFHWDWDVPIESVTEATHSWRVAVSGSVGRSDELDGERLRLYSIRLLERAANRARAALDLAAQRLRLGAQ
jgi:hypothetical protein